MALTKITKGVIKPNENYDTHNINSTGVVTATSFVGNLTGNVTGNVTGVATGLGGAPNVVVTQVVSGDVNVQNVTAGIVTATAFHGDGSNLIGVSGFSDPQGRTCGLQSAFTTEETLVLGGTGCGINTLEAPAGTGNLVFTKANNITITDIVHIKTGTTVKTDVLKLFGSGTTSSTPAAVNIVEDTTPQLGGNLDLNSNDITGTGNINITGNINAGIITGTSFAGNGAAITGISTLNILNYVPGQAGGGYGVDYQEFTSSGTWTKPPGATFVYVEVIGGGGGGASGCVTGSGNFATGGAGGTGGGFADLFIPAVVLGNTVTVTVGSGGTGGAAVSTNDTINNAGGDGGMSSFGTFLHTNQAGNGAFQASSATSGTSGRPAYTNNNTKEQFAWGGTGTSYASQYDGGPSPRGGAGGGGGNGVHSNDTVQSTEAGSGNHGITVGLSTFVHMNPSQQGGSPLQNQGTSGSVNGGDGVGPGDSGGGGFTATTSSDGGNGGNGVVPGGAGGGGSGVRNGNTSGAGGNGASGRVRVYTW
jgi:hypothetical protein